MGGSRRPCSCLASVRGLTTSLPTWGTSVSTSSALAAKRAQETASSTREAWPSSAFFLAGEGSGDEERDAGDGPLDSFFFFFGTGEAAGDSRSSASLAEGTRSTSSASSGGGARGGAPGFSACEASSRLCLHLVCVTPGRGASANGAAENDWPASVPTEGLKVELERRGENRLLVLRNAA